jgi:hypothetical protein
MVYYNKKFYTEVAADLWIAQELSNYHPHGYGTTLTKKLVENVWVVTGSRFDGCD